MFYPGRSMIRDALAWWSGQMLDLVPARFTRPDPSEAGALLVEPIPGGARVHRRVHGVDTVLADFPLRFEQVATAEDGDAAIAVPRDPGEADRLLQALDDIRTSAPGMPVLLSLPSRSALRRDVVLPLAAEAALDRVLAYEMDRLTPFEADETFFSFQVTARDRAAGRLSLVLIVVPRAPLRPLLTVLASGGAEARAIEVESASPGDRPVRIPLAHEAPVSARRQRLLLRAAAAGCAFLLVAAILLPFLLQQIGFASADRRIARVQPAVRTVQALQNRISGGSAGATLVRTERTQLGDALSVLAAMTDVLPDDSYLTDLTLRSGEVTVSGQSPSAAKLIPAISADAAFTAPAFTAPVTRVEGQGQELFSIKTQVAH